MKSRGGGGLGASLFVGAAVAALLFWNSDAKATDSNSSAPEDLPPLDPVLPDFEIPIPEIIVSNPLSQFLYMIRSTENAPVEDSQRYFRMFGNSIFSDTSNHPVLTGEKQGVRLSDSMCAAAGFGPGCVSTAAGAYQMIVPTWQRARRAGAWGDALPDFSPASQDEAARRLLIECGAFPLLRVGDLSGAIRKASKLWASLPGSTAGQGSVTLARAIDIFNQGA